MGRDKAEENNRERRWKYKSKGNAVADWATVDPQLIRDAIATVSIRGGALRFGYTSDGGAYALGVYGDGKPYTEYIRPGDDPEDYLRDLIHSLDDLPVTGRGNGNGRH